MSSSVKYGKWAHFYTTVVAAKRGNRCLCAPPRLLMERNKDAIWQFLLSNHCSLHSFLTLLPRCFVVFEYKQKGHTLFRGYSGVTVGAWETVFIWNLLAFVTTHPVHQKSTLTHSLSRTAKAIGVSQQYKEEEAGIIPKQPRGNNMAALATPIWMYYTYDTMKNPLGFCDNEVIKHREMRGGTRCWGHSETTRVSTCYLPLIHVTDEMLHGGVPATGEKPN